MLVEGELVDAYWPAARLVVELDGWEFHRTRGQFDRDRRRDTALPLKGIAVVRLTQPRVQNEAARVSAELRALMARRRVVAAATTERSGWAADGEAPNLTPRERPFQPGRPP